MRKQDKVYVARVLKVGKNKVIVNPRLKKFCFINTNEFSEDEINSLKEDLSNDKERYIDIYIHSIDSPSKECYSSYKKAKAELLWVKVVEAKNKDIVLKGKITNTTKGGYSVMLELGINAFLPSSQINEEQVGSDLIGRDVSCLIIGLNKLHWNIILSRKKAAAVEIVEMNHGKLDNISVGTVLYCIVKGINSSGIFLNIGTDHVSFAPVSECTFKYNVDITQEYYIGQQIQAVVTDIDTENNKMVFSINKIANNPFCEIKTGDRLKVIPVKIIYEQQDGNSVIGKNVSLIAKTLDSGLFCRISKEDLRFDEKAIIEMIETKEPIEVIVRHVNIDSKQVIGTTIRPKEEVWESFCNSYKESTEGVMRFRVIGKTRNALVVTHQDFEGIIPLNLLHYINTVDEFNKIKVGSIIDAKVIHINYRVGTVIISRRALYSSVITSLLNDVSSKNKVECKFLYKLGSKRIVVLVENTIEVAVDTRKVSDALLNNINNSPDDKFEMYVRHYVKDILHIELSDSQVDEQYKYKQHLHTTNIRISDIHDDFHEFLDDIKNIE